MAKATSTKAAKGGKAAKGSTKTKKVKVYGIDDMVEAVHADIQADENAPRSAKEMTKTAIKHLLKLEKSLIQGAVADGDKVTYIGHGTYERRERAARNGINPQTQKVQEFPGYLAPAFKPGKAFKDTVKKG